MQELLTFDTKIYELSDGEYLCVITYKGVQYADTGNTAKRAYRKTLAFTSLDADLTGE